MSDIGNGRAGRADVLIVGGGSAGGVLASRLSEDPTRSILLLEAGTAYGDDGYPDDLRGAAHVPGNPEHDWGLTARGGPASPEIAAPRGKALGGGSAVNATVAMRARPSDIRDWQRHGPARRCDRFQPGFLRPPNRDGVDGRPRGPVGGRGLARRREVDRRTSCRRCIDHAGRSFGGAEPHDDHDRRADRAGGLHR